MPDKQTSCPNRSSSSVSETEDRPPRVIITAATERKRATRFSAGPTTVEDDEGDSDWEDEDRHQQRERRLARRHPTAHPFGNTALHRKVAHGAPGCSLSNGMAPRSSGGGSRRVALGPATTVGEEQSLQDDEDDDAARRAERGRRIQARKPTGHPGLRAKVQQLLATNRLTTSSSSSPQPSLGSSPGQSDEEEQVSYSPMKKLGSTTGKQRSATAGTRILDGPSFLCDDGDIAWDEKDRHVARSSRIRARRPTGHPMITQKVRTMLEVPPASTGEEEEEEEHHQLSMPKPKTKKVTVARSPSVAEDAASDSWSECDRTTCRTERIKARRPTGHPAVGRKLAELLAAKDEEDSRDEDASPPPPRNARPRPHFLSVERQNVDNGDDDDDDGSPWETRHAERFARLKNRRPTGHPGIAKKVKAALASATVNDSEDDEDEPSNPSSRTQKASFAVETNS